MDIVEPFLFDQLAAEIEGDKARRHGGGDIEKGGGHMTFFRHGHGFGAEGGEGGESAAKARFQKQQQVRVPSPGFALRGDDAHEKAADDIGEKGGKGHSPIGCGQIGEQEAIGRPACAARRHVKGLHYALVAIS